MASPSPTIRISKRSSANSKSPPRRPLQERTDSNEKTPIAAAPTIRVVAESGPGAYAKSPFPSEPAHYLPPARSFSIHSNSSVSDENSLTTFQAAKAFFEGGLYPDSPLLQRHSFPGKRISTGTTVSSYDEDTLANSRSSISASLSSQYSHNTSTSSTPTLNGLTFNDEDKISAKLPALPEDHGRASTSTIRLVDSPKSNVLLRSKVSDESLSSTSSGTVVSLRRRRSTNSLPSSPPNFEVIAPSSSPCGSSTSNLPTNLDPQSPTPKTKQAPNTVFSPSSDSIAYSDASYVSVIPPSRPRSSSSPPSTSGASYSTENDQVADLQFPKIRSASASRSWATSSEPVEQANRMSDGGRSPLWSTRLSTIASESEGASDAVPSALPSPRLRRERRSIAEASDASLGLSSPSDSSIPIPAPLFSISRPELAILPQVRDSEEGDDTLGELAVPQVRPKRSGYLARLRSLSRPSSSESMKSQMSFHDDLSWVRTFYRSGQFPSQHSLYQTSEYSTSRLNTAHTAHTAHTAYTTTGTTGITDSPSSEAFSIEIHRPRNRPRVLSLPRRNPRNTRTQIVNDSQDEIQPVREANGIEAQPGTWTSRVQRPIWSSSNWGSGIFSPHLHRDRRGTAAINNWSTPSFDEPFGKKLFGPLNRQILLFWVGFLVPFSWFFAAFLPLPPQPATFDPVVAMERGIIPQNADDPFVTVNTAALAKIEYEERRYLKARWWRQLNRIMCVAGVAIIGAIITLVVIATRMHP